MQNSSAPTIFELLTGYAFSLDDDPVVAHAVATTDVDALRELRSALKELDQVYSHARRAVTLMSKVLGCSRAEAIEHMTVVARAADDAPSFDDALLLALDDHRALLSEITGLERDALRGQLYRARKRAQTSAA